jgi:hypothetical protein
VIAGLVLVVASASAAAASPKSGQRITIEYAAAGAQFTDCPATTAHPIDCLGTDVFLESFEKKVGRKESQGTTLRVTVVPVHLTKEGFTIGSPVAVGESHPEFDGDGPRKVRIKETVRLSDGTKAKINVTLKGVGPVWPSSFTGVFPEPDCPSGWAKVTLNQRGREATATGSAIIHGRTESPTSVVQTPFLLSEHDTGACVPSP